jgi:hypothetical protein
VLRDALTGPIATDAPLRVGNRTLGKPYSGRSTTCVYDRTLAPAQVDSSRFTIRRA